MKTEIVIVRNSKNQFEVYKLVTRYRFLKAKKLMEPFITYTGSETVFPFSNLETAIAETEAQVKKNAIANTSLTLQG